MHPAYSLGTFKRSINRWRVITAWFANFVTAGRYINLHILGKLRQNKPNSCEVEIAITDKPALKVTTKMAKIYKHQSHINYIQYTSYGYFEISAQYLRSALLYEFESFESHF